MFDRKHFESTKSAGDPDITDSERSDSEIGKIGDEYSSITKYAISVNETDIYSKK